MKKKKPLLWIAGAVVAVGIVSGAVSDSDIDDGTEAPREEPSPVVSVEPSEMPSEEPSPIPSEVPSEDPSGIPSETPSAEPTPSTVVTVTYIASSDSDKCHTERCRFVDNILEENIIYFRSKEEAVNAGYSACGTCKPW